MLSFVRASNEALVRLARAGQNTYSSSDVSSNSKRKNLPEATRSVPMPSSGEALRQIR